MNNPLHHLANPLTTAKIVDLWCPEAYRDLPKATLKKITNGCGTGGWLAALVPDTIYGLNITAACNIHDYMYSRGRTQNDKVEADRVMLNNLQRIIQAKTKYRWLRKLRTIRAYLYYLAVHLAGGPAFWYGKNQPNNIIATRV